MIQLADFNGPVCRGTRLVKGYISMENMKQPSLPKMNIKGLE